MNRVRIKYKRCVFLLICFTIFVMVVLAVSNNREYFTILNPEQFEALIEEAKQDNIIRQLRIEDTCRNYNLGLYKQSQNLSSIKHPPAPQYGVFYINLIDKIAFCPIYKAASTTWLYNMCLLGGYTEEEIKESKEQLSTLARKIYPVMDYPPAEKAIQESVKLLVVRHPFERILSAYRDKLENTNVGQEHGTWHFYKKYGSRIVAKYRSANTQNVYREGTYYWDPNKPKPAGIEPTFSEFVQYLLDTNLALYADDHWIPYYLTCTPCLVKFDYIAKVETLFRDQLYFIEKEGLKGRIKPRWRHVTQPQTLNNISAIYFSQLSTAQVKDLHAKYKLDFELFDYSADRYLGYAKG